MFFKEIKSLTSSIFNIISPHHKGRFYKIIMLAMLAGLIEIYVAGMVSLVGVTLASPQTILEISLIKTGIEAYPSALHFLTNPLYLLSTLLFLVIAGVIAKNSLLAFISYKQAYAIYDVTAEMASKLIYTYTKKDYIWHLNNNVSESYTIYSYRYTFAEYAMQSVNFIVQLIICLFLLCGGLILAPVACFVVFSITGLTAAVTFKKSRNKMMECNQQTLNIELEANKIALATQNGVREIKAYQLEATFYQELLATLHRISPLQAISKMLQPLPSWVLETVGMLSLLIALLLMISLNYPLAYVTGAMTLLAAVAWRMLPSVNKLVTSIMSMQAAIPYVGRFINDVDLTVIKEQETKSAASFDHKLSFEQISFHYPSSTKNVLSDINIDLNKGQSIGIIGRSGAGKTTLINLMIGLLTPTSGRITIDDDLFEMNRIAHLSSIIGYVPQSPFILDASVAENIAFNDWGLPIDEDKVLRCCQLAAIDFISALPEGIHSVLGERGSKLSGGQIQRIAIARALYSQPQILLFDEATSALDGASENKIQNTINELQKQMTVVIVAHRLSTVENCDIIYWFENGKVIASGSPKELLPRYQASLSAH
jgi:ABC-type bacteriocin/lantibiotic exporter with double-glycine peptidase domain